MAMTNEEKQEIIEAVLASIRTNSRTIEDLTAVLNLTGGECIEVNGGRKISVNKLMSLIQEAIENDSVTPLASLVDTLGQSVSNLNRDKFDKADIVEATGNSSVYVMSQKFVTLQLGNIATKLGNINVSLGTRDGNNMRLAFTDQNGAVSTLTLGSATTSKAGLLSATDKNALNEAVAAKIESMEAESNAEDTTISAHKSDGTSHSVSIPMAGTTPPGEEAPVAGVMSAAQAADLAEVVNTVFPLVASVYYTNAGVYEKGTSVKPNVVIEAKRRGAGVAQQVTVITNMNLVDMTGNESLNLLYLDSDAITENTSFNISVSHDGQTAALPQQQYRFLNYVYGAVLDEEPANIASAIYNATTLRELSTRTTYSGTLQAGEMFLFAVPGNVNLVCKHAETGAEISGCETGLKNIPRRNNANVTDAYTYIIVPASDMEWNFKITNS